MTGGSIVTVFNANELAMTIAVNSGAMAAVGPFDELSGLPASNATIGWSTSGPLPGSLAPGPNLVQVQFGAGSPVNIQMTLPPLEPASVQIYLFMPPHSRVGAVTWFVLFAGVVVASGLANPDEVIFTSRQGGEA